MSQVNLPGTTRDVCNQCEVAAEASQFSRCARCKKTTYCSRECQKKHWKLHKLVCQKMAEAEELNRLKMRVLTQYVDQQRHVMPPPQQRIEYLRRWAMAHTWSIRHAIQCARVDWLEKHDGHELDLRTMYLRLDLTYRRPNDGNPSTLFTIEDGGLHRLEDLKSASASTVDNGDDKKKDPLSSAYETAIDLHAEDDRETQAEDMPPEYLGSLLVMYMMDGEVPNWGTVRQYNLPEGFQDDKVLMHDKWLKQFARNVRKGFVIQNIPDEEVPGKTVTRAGHLMQVGQEWLWVPLSPDDLIKMGFHEEEAEFLFQEGMV